MPVKRENNFLVNLYCGQQRAPKDFLALYVRRGRASLAGAGLGLLINQPLSPTQGAPPTAQQPNLQEVPGPGKLQGPPDHSRLSLSHL